MGAYPRTSGPEALALSALSELPRRGALLDLHPGIDPAPLSDYEIDHDHYDEGSDQRREVVHSPQYTPAIKRVILLPPHVLGLFVLPQPHETGMPKVIIEGPLQELKLPH